MIRFFENSIKSNLRLFCVIAVSVFLAYSFMLQSPFKTLDDDFSIVKNEDIRSMENIPKQFRSKYFKSDQDYYRPLVYVTYTLEHHFFKLNHFFYNLDNVFLHILNAWLAFLLIGLLLPERKLAVAAGILYAIHPIHWEAVGNISGRAILLCAFFVLAGLVCFIRYRQEKKPLLLVMAVVCYILGLMSKESAGVMIMTAVAYVALVERPPVLLSLRIWLWTLPFGVVAAGYLLLRKVMGISKMFPWPDEVTMVQGLVTFLKGMFIYLGLIVMPVGLHFDRGLVIFKSFQDPMFYVTIMAWAAVIIGVWRKRAMLVGLPLFCMAWFLIELFPVSQIITTIGVYPGAISLAEHFLYVASLPMIILLVWAAGKLITSAQHKGLISAQVLPLALSGLFLFYYVMLVQQNLYASNEFVMLRDSLAKDPQNARLQYSMAMMYAKRNDFDKAVEHFRKAVELHECNYAYNIALGKALTDKGDLIGAARVYEMIPPPKEPNLLLDGNKRAVYALLAADYEKKVAISPEDPAQHFALGVFYAKLGRVDDALRAFRRTVELKPDHTDALLNIAAAEEALGRLDAAFEAYTRLASIPGLDSATRAKAVEGLSRLEVALRMFPRS